MSMQIPLTKGQYTLVDDADYERLAAYDWKFSSRGYAFRHVKRANGRWTYEYMHRILLGVKERSVEVDHVNRNKLDNRRTNLRLATHSQNQQNKGLPQNNTTTFKGVTAFHGKYSVGLRWNGSNVHIALVADLNLAAHLYDALARILFKDFAHPNFQCTATTPEIDFYMAKVLARLRRKGLLS